VKTGRTFPNYKPDITSRDYERGNYLLLDIAVSADKKVRSRKDFKIRRPTIEIQSVFEHKTMYRVQKQANRVIDFRQNC
jgi:hypothetical protein